MDLLKLGREIGAEAERVRWKLRMEPLVSDIVDFTQAEEPDFLTLWIAANRRGRTRTPYTLGFQPFRWAS